MEAVLFHEAIFEAVYTLSLRQSMRSSLKETYEKRGMTLPESLPLEMSSLAQGILDQPFSDGRAISSTEQIARVKFALTLDPSCSDAYLMRGAVEEQKGHYLKAEEDYKRAVELAAEKLGPDAFLEETRRAGQIHFWYSDGTRPYMRARASLAYLLWQKLNRLPEAIAHFQEMW